MAQRRPGVRYAVALGGLYSYYGHTVPEGNMEINSNWRVIEHRHVSTSGDPVIWYWRLERKHKYGGWVFSVQCATRNALIRHVKQKCGDVDPEIIRKLNKLPTYLGDQYFGQYIR